MARKIKISMAKGHYGSYYVLEFIPEIVSKETEPPKVVVLTPMEFARLKKKIEEVV